MPQAVNAYLDTKNLSVVDAKKREIIELYADDFRKLDPTGRATRLFMATPSQLTGNASRYQVTSVLGRSQDEDEMAELILDMEDSMAVNFSYHATDLGYVYENVVAQILRSRGEKLFYHTWPTPSGKHNYEIDFLLSRGFKICPVEVKSSGYKTHKSMDEFCKKFSQHVGLRYLVYTKDSRKDGELTLIPVYHCMFI